MSGAREITRTQGVILVLFLTALLGMKGLESARTPLVDQANFELVARELIQGKSLYKDLWDVKPPGIFWIYATIRLILGGSHGAVVLVDTLLVFMALALVMLSLERIQGLTPLARVMSMSFIVSMLGFAHFAGSLSILQTETATNFVVALVLFLGTRNLLGPVTVAICGAAVTFLKGFPLFVVLLVAVPFWKPGRRLGNVLLSTVGASMLVGLWVGWLWRTESLGAFLEALRYGRFYQNLSLTPATTLLPLIPILALPTLFSLMSIFWWPRTPGTLALLLWLVVSSLGILLQGKFWGYHFLAIIVPLGVAAGIGLEGLHRRLGPGAGRWLVLSAALAQGAVTLESQLEFNVSTVEYLAGRLSKQRFLELQIISWNLMTADEIEPVIDALRSETRPESSLLIFGIVPQVALLAPRRFHGPYVFHYFLLGSGSMSTGFESLADRQERFINRFDALPPESVLVPDNQSPQPGVFENSKDLEDFHALKFRLDRDYEVNRIGTFRLYVRKVSLDQPALTSDPAP